MANIGYIYKTTNIVNNKIYIGQHQRDEFDKKYYGSGIKIQRALRKYGKKNFIVEVICWCDSIDRLNKSEKDFIRAFTSNNPKIGYNISIGGQVGGMKGHLQTEETKKLIGLASKGNKHCKGKIPWNKGKKGVLSKETLNKMSISAKGRKPSEYNIKRSKEVNSGKKLSEETKRKISMSSIGKKGTRTGAIISPEQRLKCSLAQKGKIITDEMKKNMSIAHKGKRASSETKQKMSLAHKGKSLLKAKGRIPWNKGLKGVQVAWNKGIPCKDSMKEKLSIVNKESYANGNNGLAIYNSLRKANL